MLFERDRAGRRPFYGAALPLQCAEECPSARAPKLAREVGYRGDRQRDGSRPGGWRHRPDSPVLEDQGTAPRSPWWWDSSAAAARRAYTIRATPRTAQDDPRDPPPITCRRISPAGHRAYRTIARFLRVCRPGARAVRLRDRQQRAPAAAVYVGERGGCRALRRPMTQHGAPLGGPAHQYLLRNLFMRPIFAAGQASAGQAAASYQEDSFPPSVLARQRSSSRFPITVETGTESKRSVHDAEQGPAGHSAMRRASVQWSVSNRDLRVLLMTTRGSRPESIIPQDWPMRNRTTAGGRCARRMRKPAWWARSSAIRRFGCFRYEKRRNTRRPEIFEVCALPARRRAFGPHEKWPEKGHARSAGNQAEPRRSDRARAPEPCLQAATLHLARAGAPSGQTLALEHGTVRFRFGPDTPPCRRAFLASRAGQLRRFQAFPLDIGTA